MARSILSFMATMTAVTCSAALPTIGRRIKPMKVLEIPVLVTIESIESTRYSAQNATAIVTTNSMKTASTGSRVDSCSSSTTSAPVAAEGVSSKN
ncbi:hypothetical protein AWJ20_960 [Sugiyamaella lignohabitans]|uniref:Secreted protein n=1 Tax=Sugiyamaella lignohabitans TaxID=796027 RepID=A0A167DAX0_9ASCO|nr:uncharacterized protein AWJ20_960 [Sugiyamaella lignohabitans]ANB12693.1 hypothetical protein AWJ20_960 [Sugiyamaella lignohabitans]